MKFQSGTSVEYVSDSRISVGGMNEVRQSGTSVEYVSASRASARVGDRSKGDRKQGDHRRARFRVSSSQFAVKCEQELTSQQVNKSKSTMGLYSKRSSDEQRLICSDCSNERSSGAAEQRSSGAASNCSKWQQYD